MMQNPGSMFFLGVAFGVTVMGIFWVLQQRRMTSQLSAELETERHRLDELRSEMQADRETNRSLRHQLARAGGHPLPEDEDASDQPNEELIDLARRETEAERDLALQQLASTEAELESVTTRLVDREAKLKEYREALTEIRISLESSGRAGAISEVEATSEGLSPAE